MSTQRSISTLVELCSNWDKDERYMALQDLCTVLSREDGKINSQEEGRVVMAVLNALKDVNNDVKSAAVKCVAALVKKVRKDQIAVICDELCKLIQNDQKDHAALRDIYSIALRTLIDDVPDTMGNEVSTRLTKELLKGINQTEVNDIKKECLHILEPVLKRFGTRVSDKHLEIRNSILKCLCMAGSELKSVRKIAAECLAALALVSSETNLNKLVEIILELIAREMRKTTGDKEMVVEAVDEVSASLDGSDVRTLIQTIGTISRTIGHRLGKHLKKLVPLFFECIGERDEELGDDNESALKCEIREFCFNGLESFVKCCPVEIAPFLVSTSEGTLADEGEMNILSKAMEFTTFDPNYVGDAEDMDEDIDAGSEDGYSDYDDDEEEYFEDDDDTSWKVRRASVRVVKAIVVSRTEMNAIIYETCVDDLIKRLKERAEQVRIDVLQTFIAILEATQSHAMNTSRSRVSLAGGAAPLSAATSFADMEEVSEMPVLRRQRSTINFLKDKLDDMIGAVCRLLNSSEKENSIECKNKALEMVSKLLETLNEPLSEVNFNNVVSVILNGMTGDKLSALRLNQLRCLRQIVDVHHHVDVQQYISNGSTNNDGCGVTIPGGLDGNAMIPSMIQCINEDGYKNITEALALSDSLISKMRPLHFEEGEEAAGDAAFDFQSYAGALYSALKPRLEAQDIDQEIKRAAIRSIAVFLYHTGDVSESVEMQSIVSILSTKLDNEVTRVSTLKAITLLCESPLNIDVSMMTNEENLSKISLYLKQQARDTRISAIQCLTNLLIKYPDNFKAYVESTQNTCNAMLMDVSTVVNDSDLFICCLALHFLGKFLDVIPMESVAQAYHTHLYTKVMKLASSSLLQGPAQDVLVSLLQTMTQMNMSSMTYDDMFSLLYESNGTVSGKTEEESMDVASDTNTTVTAAGKKQSAYNVAVAIGGMLSVVDNKLDLTVAKLVSDLSGTDEIKKHLALWCLGVIGQKIDLSNTNGLEQHIMACFSSSSQDTQTAAAYALGNIAVGNMGTYLPIILTQMSNCEPTRAYSLLAALREIINVFAGQGRIFDEYAESVNQVIIPFTKAAEVSDRNIASECLGLQCYMNCENMSGTIKSLFDESMATDNEALKWSVATIMRYALNRAINRMDEQDFVDITYPYLPPLLKDPSIDVRKAVVLSLNAISHKNPQIMIAHSAGHAASQGADSEDSLLGQCFNDLVEAAVFKEQIIVETGPFKQKIDLGLPLRKAAVSCLETMVDNIPDKLNFAGVLRVIEQNIGDALKVKDDQNFQDLKLHSHAVLIKSCNLAPGSVLGFIEEMLPHMKATLDKKMKESAVPSDVERALELKRSTLRVVQKLTSLENIDSSSAFKEFKEKIATDEFLSNMMNELRSGEKV